MKLKEAIKILEHHNKWRTDNSFPSKIPMQEPKKITKAIDTVLTHLKESK